MRVLVTRPQPSAEALAAVLGAEGATAICVPAIEIVPLEDASLDAFSPAPDDAAIFTSVPAVEFFFAQVSDAVDRLPRMVFAIGPATAAALRKRGLGGVLLPPPGRFDSEGLLAAPALAAERIPGRGVWIVKGEGGRRLLGDALRRRAGAVFELALYRRRAPTGLAGALDDLRRRGGLASIDAITVASVATFEYLIAAADRSRISLEGIPLVAAGERVAAAIRAEQFGPVGPVVAAADAGHAAFVEALVGIRLSTVDGGFERRSGGEK